MSPRRAAKASAVTSPRPASSSSPNRFQGPKGAERDYHPPNVNEEGNEWLSRQDHIRHGAVTFWS